MQDIRQFVQRIVKAFGQKDRNGICNLIMLEEDSPGLGELHKALYPVRPAVWDTEIRCDPTYLCPNIR